MNIENVFIDKNEKFSCRICKNNNNFIKLIDDKKFCLIKCYTCGFIFREDRIIKNKPVIIEKDICDVSEDPTGCKNWYYYRFNKRIKEIIKYKKNPGKILDIGCAWGYFLDIARDRGWDVYGVDIDKTEIEYCKRKGIKVYQGEIVNMNFHEKSFDTVCMFHVLEHVYNVKQTLSEVYKILKSDGLFVVEIPTIGSLKARIYGKYWSYITEDHINYFTVKLLKRILENEGFKILKIKFYSTTGIMNTINKITHKNVGSKLNSIFSFLSPIKSISEKIFSMPYLGDILIIYAKKCL